MTDFRCTYRLQLTEQFGFGAARELAVPYIAELGASHLYLSPVLQARHGSTHGYDVVDPTQISEDLGGEAEFRALCGAAREAGLGVVLDIVPNHMATSDDENPFWRDLGLREKFFDWDPASGWYRRFFDIGELGGVRVEDPDVFEVTHAKALELVQEASSTGSASTTPTASQIRASISTGYATEERGTFGSRRFSSRASACATGPSKGRPATSSQTTSPRSSSTRPERSR